MWTDYYTRGRESTTIHQFPNSQVEGDKYNEGYLILYNYNAISSLWLNLLLTVRQTRIILPFNYQCEDQSTNNKEMSFGHSLSGNSTTG